MSGMTAYFLLRVLPQALAYAALMGLIAIGFLFPWV